LFRVAVIAGDDAAIADDAVVTISEADVRAPVTSDCGFPIANSITKVRSLFHRTMANHIRLLDTVSVRVTPGVA
jgi:hypothetical protein